MRVLRETWLRWPALALAAVALVLIGYVLGDDGPPPRTADAEQASMVVSEFARASDEKACDLLTEEALSKIYRGRRRCIERSARFESGTVRITKVTVVENRASVKATSLDGSRLFSVRLQKSTPGCDAGLPGNPWLISEIREQPNT